ncbi:hypothetical protein [Streptosporangium sp. NPDC048865]|uniref:hypothetical protein n=1 Tax=Streptosporangium sp. NPDC048865 TaxID=3155766 RepID=UPI0034302F49
MMGPIQWLLDGNSLGRAVSDAEAMMFVFAAGGIPHLAAVLAAMALMFGPTANAYFRSARGR